MKRILRGLRVILVPRSLVTAAACGLVALAMLYVVGHPAIVGATAARRQLPIYCVQRDYKVVSLTFDAAWGNEDTEQLIAILGKYKVSATFFVVGDWVEKYPESVKALFDAGHEIMNHSDDHKHFNPLSREQIVADLTACNDKIEAVTGVRPTLFRPPYGEYDDHVIETVRSIGMEPIQWDVDSLDWKDLTAEQITKRVVERVEMGSIVLFHNAAKNTPAALPDIIEGLIQKGYTFLPASQIILPGPYTIDHTGRQCPAPDAPGTASAAPVLLVRNHCGTFPCSCPEGGCRCAVCSGQ